MRFWSTFFGSFSDADMYTRVRYEQRSWGLFYAFLVVALTTFVATLWLGHAAYQLTLAPRGQQLPLLDNLTAQIAQQLPELELQNGVLEVKDKQPLVITVTDAVDGYGFKSDFITIDTTGATTYQQMQTPVLITRTDIVTKKNNGETTIHALKDMTRDGARRYSRADIVRLLTTGPDVIRDNSWKLALVVLPFVWGVFALIFYVGRVIMLLLLGGVALLVGNIGHSKMNYMTAVRLSSVAYTPLAIFTTMAFLIAFATIGSLQLFIMGALLVSLIVVVTTRKEA